MRMSINSYNKMNILLGKCFNANAVIDNLAYNLDYYYFNEIAKIVHLKVAHVMPELADMVSDKMLELSARPVRVEIGGYQEDYSNLTAIFNVLGETLEDLRVYTKELIEFADMEGDDEIRIFAENFLDIMSPYIKQSEEWIHASEALSPAEFNIHIKEYTHFIEV